MVKFKNKLEEDAFLIAQSIYGDRTIIEHNKPLRIENALLPGVASFSGPPKKEIDVLGAEIHKNPKIDILVSCKEFESFRAEPAHVQEWAAVINTMSKYSAGTKYLGIILCPTGFSRGCEPWATSYNLGLIPPLKGKLMSFPYSASLQMFERTLKAISKRVLFPHDNLFVSPAFYDFCFQITSVFEGFEETTIFKDKPRHFLAESGWRSSFGELVTTFQELKVEEIIYGINYLGIKCENGKALRVFNDRIVFGVFDDSSSQLEEKPICRDRITGEILTFDYVCNLVIGKPITSALDAGEYLELGINNNINILFHPIHGIIITEFGPNIESATAKELFSKMKKKRRRKKKL